MERKRTDLPMEEALAETGWRGSAEVWLEAAYDTLLESGVDSVRILPLAKRLNLSRTSFYWFFKDRDALLAALIGLWKKKNTGNLVHQCEAYAESIVEAMLNVFDCWFDQNLFDTKFEFAVRSWAIQSPQLLVQLTEADDVRLTALSEMFRRHGFEPSTADVRARTAYLVQIGYISMQVREDPNVRMRRVSDYVTIFTGQAPQQRDLDRFVSRHTKLLQAPAFREPATATRSTPKGRGSDEN